MMARAVTGTRPQTVQCDIFFSFTTHKNCRKISLFVFMFRGHICYIYSKCNAANEFFRCAYFYDQDNKKNGFRPYDTMSASKKMRRHKNFALSFVENIESVE